MKLHSQLLCICGILIGMNSPAWAASQSNEVQTNKFKAAPPSLVPQPEIIRFQHSGNCVNKSQEFTIIGRHFGVNGQNRGKAVWLRFGGSNKALAVAQWSDTSIRVKFPSDPELRTGRYLIDIGIVNTRTSQWLSNTNVHLNVCRR